jgi:biopolymer transport protein ExbD
MMTSGGLGGGDNHNRPMAEINTTPLVDVMLVLLVIFIITAPLLTHAVKIDLPQAGSQPSPEKPDIVTLSIDAEGKLFWNNTLLADTDLAARFEETAGKTPQPELHLRADKNTPYQQLAIIMTAAQSAGLTRLGFVTDPSQQH